VATIQCGRRGLTLAVHGSLGLWRSINDATFAGGLPKVCSSRLGLPYPH
jgi:hypothetical protein